MLPGFDDVSHFTCTPEVYHYEADVTIGAEDKMLHRSPESGCPRAAAFSPSCKSPSRLLLLLKVTQVTNGDVNPVRT